MFSFHQNAETAPEQRADDDVGARSSELLDALQQLVEQFQNAEQATDRINDLADKLEVAQESIDHLTTALGPVVHWIQNNDKAAEEADVEVDKNSWEYRKQSLLNGYISEVDAGTSRSQAAADQSDDKQKTSSATDNDHSVKSGDGSWLSDDNFSSHDEAWSREVMDLRSILEEKLRRAEIEISIERARLSRVNQELENRRNELDLEMAHIRSNMANAGGSDDQSQPRRSRLSRFLGRADKDGK